MLSTPGAAGPEYVGPELRIDVTKFAIRAGVEVLENAFDVAAAVAAFPCSLVYAELWLSSRSNKGGPVCSEVSLEADRKLQWPQVLGAVPSIHTRAAVAFQGRTVGKGGLLPGQALGDPNQEVRVVADNVPDRPRAMDPSKDGLAEQATDTGRGDLV